MAIQDFSGAKINALDPTLHDTQAEIEVVVRPLTYQVAGKLLTAGKHKLLVPSSILPSLKKLVEDDSLVKQAEEGYKHKLEVYVKRGGQASRFTGSPASEFFQRNMRSPLPFKSLKVLKTDIAPRLDADEKRLAAIAKHLVS